MKRVLMGFSFFALLAVASLASAQGVQTGTVTGTVQSADGLSLPGVTVTASSPALQGQRSTVTDLNGVFFIRGLPSGSQTMSLAGVAETVNVTATSTPAALTSPTLSQVYSKRELDTLPVGRVPAQVAELAPGLTSNTPNAGQVTISGATAFDNVFMMNGVDINDNLFGTANNLFIEDAIQETNILTG